MIDEYFNRLIDHLCLVVPRTLKPWWTWITGSCIGWRLQLYFGTLGRNIAGLFSKVSNEDSMDLTLREGGEQFDETVRKAGAFFREQIELLIRLDARSRNIRFAASLYLTLLSVLGVAATGHNAMGVMAASSCMLWLSMAMESGYAPVCGQIRQRYLAATLLRAGSIGLMLIQYFFAYAVQGVPSNVVLQSAMIIMLAIHLALYLTLVMLNTRQPFFLRALVGVTGVVPALTAAAACALAASCLFRPWPLPFSGLFGAVGAVLAFLGDQLITIRNLGGIRLKYHSVWVCLLLIVGYALMLFGCWTYTL